MGHAGERLSMSLSTQQDYSNAKQPSVTQDTWQDSLMLSLAQQKARRPDVATVATQQRTNALSCQLEVSRGFADAQSRMRAERAVRNEQERRAFWHLKWAANEAGDP